MQEPLEADLAAVLQVAIINDGHDLLTATDLVNCVVHCVEIAYLI